MAPTLRRVVGTPELDLRVRCGADALERPVHWVAVSELPDPTPFLEGGELLLTTGLWHTGSAEAATAWIRRVADRGVAGLGFGVGVGVGHDEVPPEVLTAAERAGLPLLEVPRPTPFMAISRAVADLLAADRYEELNRSIAMQQELTRAALRGPEAVVTLLARQLDGWAALLDTDRRPRHAAPPDAAAGGVAALSAALDRIAAPPPADGPPSPARRPSAASVVDASGHAVAHALGGDQPVGYLLAGTAGPLDARRRTALAAAVSLLSLELERPEVRRVTERRLRTALLRALLTAREPAVWAAVDDAVGGLPDPVRVAQAALPAGAPPRAGAVGEALRAAERDAALRTALLATEGGTLWALLPDAPAAIAAFGRATRPLVCGVSEPVTPADLPAAVRQAERSRAEAERRGTALARHEELAPGFLGLVDAPSADEFARSRLGALLAGRQPAELLATLRAYLARGGRWDAAARDLGVHRHTVRHRVERVAELLRTDLDDPDVRAELWIALRIHDGRPA
ncbi:PucR family transcriptional regulator [Allostreptomyces psammosilenae]|uniref:Purine catabolism regulator n=1 Tax=Allostreptomyces psammosilenae TaxID=1892865 RepID=A0A853A3B2_9ACTN|nr:PucR family transcriptional regulator [Allostreptomyces psammosilenae]NYI04968.1 purine catabolism regulator [Allostreptomyces psammosilenae]